MGDIGGPEDAARWARWVQARVPSREIVLLLRNRRPVAALPVTWTATAAGYEMLLVMVKATGTYLEPNELRRFEGIVCQQDPPVLDVLVVCAHLWRSLRELQPHWAWRETRADYRSAA